MSAPRHIAILGDGGPVAWLAALALRRAFKHLDLDIAIVEEAGVHRAGCVALPSLRSLHALCGVDERAFVRATGAGFRLGSVYSGWNRDGGDFLHVHGEIGASLGSVPFYKHLIHRRLRAGRTDRPEAYSLAAMAAQAGRFARPSADPRSPFAHYAYGYHLDLPAYSAHLRGLGQRHGVRRHDDDLFDAAARTPDGDVEALVLRSGERVGADLFLDCSGAEAKLIGQLTPDNFDDWSPWLACDSLATSKIACAGAASVLTQVSAADAGWLWRADAQDGSVVGYAFASAFVDEPRAARALEATFGASEISFAKTAKPGRRRFPWARNCVALGAAAVSMEPLGGIDLHLAQVGISNLVSLFPLSGNTAVEAAEYSRLMAEYADGALDFVLAHYRAAPTREGAFWSEMHRNPAPARLQHKLDLFGANGRVTLLDFETFEEVDWAWLLLGRGLWPETLEPHVRLLLEKVSLDQGDLLSESLRRSALTMPMHDEYLLRAGLKADVAMDAEAAGSA